MFAHASPKKHLRWYQDLGVNTIQTFCVNCCGYAWYKQSAVAPVQPGLKSDFLKEMTDLGHAAGMRVMGYFCVGANTYWGRTQPDLSHGTPATRHIPFTTHYLDYLCRSIEDAVTKVPIDGFMVDWLFSPPPQWIDCEQTLYTELFQRPFPGRGAMGAAETAEFLRRSTERAWVRIRQATRSARPECVIWLSCYDLREPQVVNSVLFKQTDWLMNESPDTTALDAVRKETGPHTRLIQCVCGWGDKHDAEKVVKDPAYADVGIYGFAAADPHTTLPVKDTSANARNIEAIRRAFRGL